MATRYVCCLLLVVLLSNLGCMTTATVQPQDSSIPKGREPASNTQTTVTPQLPQPIADACGPQFTAELERANRLLESAKSTDTASARAIYQGVVTKDPECIAAYEGISSTYAFPENATEALAAMVEKYDKSAAAHHVLGKSYLRERLWMDAAREFEAAIELGAPGSCASLGLEIAFYNLDVLESVDIVYNSVNQFSPGRIIWNCPDLESNVAQIPGWGGKDYLSDLPPIGIMWRTESNIDGRRQDLLWALGHMYVKKGQIESNKGSFLSALRYYQDALSVYEKLNENWKQLVAEKGVDVTGPNVGFFMPIADAVTEAEILTEISSIYLRIGNRPLSVEYIEKARASSRTALALAGLYNQFILSQVQPTIEYLEGIGNLVTQNYSGAIQRFDKLVSNKSYLGPFQVSMETLAASALATNSGGDWSRIKAFQSIGSALSSVGEYQTASKYLERGLASCKVEDLPPFWQYYGYNNRLGCTMILTELGKASFALDKSQEAKSYFQEALSSAKQLNDPIVESEAAFGLGTAEERQGNVEAALDHYLLAVELRERVANQLPVESLRGQFESGTAEIYEHVISLLSLSDKPELAFSYTERARARAFLDQLGNRRVNPKGSEDTRLIQQETELKNGISDLELKLQKESSKPQGQRDQRVLDQVTTSLNARRQEYSILLTKLQVTNREYADLVTVSPLDLRQAQALLRDQMPDMTLVTYYVSERNTTIFVIGPQTFHIHSTRVTRQELREQIELLLQQMKAKSLLPKAWQEPAQTLYNWLVTPIESYLPPATSDNPSRLGIVPHDLLNYLPFGLLYDKKNVLSDNYALSFAPSVSSLPFILGKRHSQASTILAMTNPDAPGAAHLHFALEEVKEIAALYNSEPLIGQNATEGTFKAKAGMYGLVHIAAHSDYNPESPLFSAILLQASENEDGRLETHEVMNLDLPNTDLVVLSACETHLGELSRGDELVGLERAFIRAGAPSLLTTLWSVDDATTKILMKRFYTHLRAGVPKAEALYLSQKETRAEYPNPYYWAGFVLVGDSGQSGTRLQQNTKWWPLSTAAMIILVALSGLGTIGALIIYKHIPRRLVPCGVASICVVALGIVVAVTLSWNQIRPWSIRTPTSKSAVQATSTRAVARQTTAVAERDRAEAQSRIAFSRQLAAQAMLHVEDQFDLSALLSMEALTAADTVEARSALLTGLQAHLKLAQYLGGHTANVASVAFSPDGKTLASGGGDATARLWNVVTRQPLGQPLKGHTSILVSSVAFSPDGKTLASGSWDNTIILWDVATRQPLGQPLKGHTHPVHGVAFSPDGKVLASGSMTKTVILWDVATRQPLGQPLKGHTDAVWSVAFSPDGKVLASGSQDKTIILWDVATRQPLGQPLKGHTNQVTCVTFSPDGKMLASGSWDDTIILWDVATRQPLGQPLKGHTIDVWSVAFSPDGKTLASGSQDKTIILWDVATRQPLGQPLKGHTDAVWSVAFSPDGKMLASGSWDNTILLWDISVESWKARACEIVARNLTRAEWAQYSPGEPYHKTCPNIPEGK